MQKRLSALSFKSLHSEEQSLLEQVQRKFEELFLLHPKLDPDQAFYLQASKLHQQYLQKTQDITIIKAEITALKPCQPTSKKPMGASNNNSQQNDSQKRKRMRRTAVQIARHYVCSIVHCSKSYGSEGSLNQHMKIKHQQHYSEYMLRLNMGQGSHSINE